MWIFGKADEMEFPATDYDWMVRFLVLGMNADPQKSWRRQKDIVMN